MNYIELYISGKSIPQVSEITGLPKSTIRFRLKKIGVLRERSIAIKMRLNSPDYKHHFKGKKRTFTKEWKENIGKGKRGKGKGYRINSKGYKEFTMGEKKGKLEHVYLVEQLIGRKLNKNECVHHKDENKLNNSIENLQLMTREEHARHHAKKNYKNRIRNKKGQFI